MSHFYEGDFYQDIVQHLPDEQQLQLYLQHFFAMLLERFRLPKTTIFEIEETQSQFHLFMSEYGLNKQKLVELNSRALNHAQQTGDLLAIRRFSLEKEQSERLIQRVTETLACTLSVEQLSALINHDQDELKTIALLVENNVSIYSIIKFLSSISVSKKLIATFLNNLDFRETTVTDSSPLIIWANLERGQKIWLGPAYYSVMPQSPIHGLFSVNQIEQIVYFPEGKFVVLKFHTLTQMSHHDNQQIINHLLGLKVLKPTKQKSKSAQEESLMLHSIPIKCNRPTDQILSELNRPFQKRSPLNRLVSQLINAETLTHAMSPTLLELARLWIKILEFETTLTTESFTPEQSKRLEIFWDTVINPSTRIISYIDQRQSDVIFKVYTETKTIKNKRQLTKAIKSGLRDNKPIVLESLVGVERVIAGTLSLRLTGASQIGRSVKLLNMFMPCPSFQDLGRFFDISVPDNLSRLVPDIAKAQQQLENNTCPCGQQFVNGICHACGLRKNKFQQAIAQKKQLSNSNIGLNNNLPKKNPRQNKNALKSKNDYQYNRPMGLGDFVYSLVA